jgi:signal transduction histidine kinase
MKDRLAILGRLGGGVAHDLARDLDVIEESLRIIKWHGLGPEPRLAFDEASDAIRRLTSSLLGFAEGETGTPTLVDLAALVRRAIDRCGAIAARGVRVVVDAPEGLPPVRAHVGDLEMLVLNALLHAAEGLPADGHVLVSVDRDRETIVVDVSAERSGGRLRPVAGTSTRCAIAFPIANDA